MHWLALASTEQLDTGSKRQAQGILCSGWMGNAELFQPIAQGVV